MPASRSAPVAPSNTSLVTDALAAYDDFLSIDDLVAATGLKPKMLLTALGWLQKIKAVDAIEAGGRPYWFLTPQTDRRVKVITDRKKEDEPRSTKPGARRRKTGL